MRRLIEAVLVAMTASAAVAAHAQASADTQADAKELAREALDGREMIVRLYLDWRTDPKAYVALNVPAEGFEVKAGAVRSAYAHSRPSSREATSEEPREVAVAPGGELDEAIVVVMPGDQQDQAVLDVLEGLIFVRSLKQGSLVLQPGDAECRSGDSDLPGGLLRPAFQSCAAGLDCQCTAR
jgi:hypothetical protein